MSTGSRFVYPTGKTPEQLFLTLKTLIDRLNQITAKDASDLSGIQEAIAAAQSELANLVLELEGIEAAIGGIGDTLNDYGDQIGNIAQNPMLSAQKLFELSLVTHVDNYLGSVSNLVKDTIQRSNQAAEAAIKATLAGLQNKGEIRVEQVVRKSENEVFVSQLSNFDASLGNAHAAIANEIIARSDGDSALASDISLLTAVVNGNTGQILTISESIGGLEGSVSSIAGDVSSLEGSLSGLSSDVSTLAGDVLGLSGSVADLSTDVGEIKLRHAVTLNINGQVIGLMQLDGTPAGSNFTVVADKFLIAQPGESGGDPVPVFAIANVGGSPKLAFRGDMYADGTITAQKLNVSTLSAITANLGTVTTGRIQNSNNTSYWDLNTGNFQIG